MIISPQKLHVNKTRAYLNYKVNNSIKLKKTECNQYHCNNDPSIPPQFEKMGTCQLSQQSGDQNVGTGQATDLSPLWSTSAIEKYE